MGNVRSDAELDENMMRSCNCPYEAAEFLYWCEFGTYCCWHENVIWEKKDGVGQVITMYRGFRVDDRTGSIKWGKGKGTLEWSIQYSGSCQSCKEPVERMAQQDVAEYHCATCGTEYFWTKTGGLVAITAESKAKAEKEEKEEEVRLASYRQKALQVRNSYFDGSYPDANNPKTNKDLYTDAYWKYINASGYEDSVYWMNQMMAQVTLDLEPRADGKSWAEDPKAPHEHTWRCNLIYGVIPMLVGIILFVGIILGIVH